MADSFPTSLDEFTNPTTTSDTATLSHASQHSNANDAIEALEAKVGVTSSAVTSSLDYKINHITVTNITDVTASKDELNVLDGIPATLTATELGYVDGVTSAIQTQLNDKAPLASPTFTGTVTLPVALSGIAKLTSGVVSAVTAPSGTIVGTTDTQTLTNKRTDPRIVSAASYTTDTGTSLSVATTDIFVVTAQAGALKFNNPGGTPVQGDKLLIRIKDDGTARALTYDTQFRALGTALPSTTVLSKTLYMGFIYNSTDTKWDLVAAAQEA